MLNTLFKGYLAAMAVKLLDNYRHLSIQFLKIETAKSYIHGVHMARLSALGLMRLGLVIGLIFVGVLLLHVGLFILLPWSLTVKAVLGIVLGLAYVTMGVVALCLSMDEKSWMRKSGATALLEEATGRVQTKEVTS
jgi:hypothetical protein